MKKKKFLMYLAFASIISFSSIVVANDNTPKEEKIIVLTDKNNSGANDKNLTIPVTATLSNDVLNVQFTGSVPMATVTVSNAMTGATISQQSLPAVNGTVTTVPVAGLAMGTVTVTNQLSGQSVSGEFVVNDGQE